MHFYESKWIQIYLGSPNPRMMASKIPLFVPPLFFHSSLLLLRGEEKSKKYNKIVVQELLDFIQPQESYEFVEILQVFK